jgi:hypothetical protein
MLQYPVDVKQVSSTLFRAVWVDFPDLPRGQGADAKSAFEALVEATYPAIADTVAMRAHPEPSPSDGFPTVGFSLPGYLYSLHISRLLSVTSRGSSMKTYAWTNALAYFE